MQSVGADGGVVVVRLCSRASGVLGRDLCSAVRRSIDGSAGGWERRSGVRTRIHRSSVFAVLSEECEAVQSSNRCRYTELYEPVVVVRGADEACDRLFRTEVIVEQRTKTSV